MNCSGAPSSKYSVARIIGLHEWEEFDMDRAECRTQDAEISGTSSGARGYFVTTGKGSDPTPSEIKDRKDQRLERFRLRVLAAQIQQSSKHLLKPPLAVPNQTSSFAGGSGLDLNFLHPDDFERGWLLLGGAVLLRTINSTGSSSVSGTRPVLIA